MRVAALFLSLALGGMALADIPRPANTDATLETLAQAYEATGRFGSVTIDAASQTVTGTLASGEAFTTSVFNLHQMLLTAPDDRARQSVVDIFVAGIIENLDRPGPTPTDADHIYPLIRSKDYATQAQNVPYTEPFMGDMLIYYVLDLPSSMTFLSKEDIIAAGLDPATISSRALENFAPLEADAKLQGQDVWMVVLDGNYELSLLLDGLLWERLDGQIGTIVAIPAARDLLLIADDQVPGAVDRMRQIVTDNWSTFSYPMSQMLIEWTGTGWNPYE